MPIQLSCSDMLALCRAEASPSAQPMLLLDVRQPWEAELASIRLERIETRLIPMAELVERLGELDPAQPVVAYCHHGVRSLQVVAFLERQGFESVYNLAGGIDAWSREVDVSVPRY